MSDDLKQRYQIIGELGRGGMGVVYHARDGLLHRDVAIKQLSLDMGEDAPLGATQAIQRFLIEARAAANLQHPNVVTLYDVVDGSPPYIVMEYVVGDTLRDIVDSPGGGALDLKDACTYLEAMCKGLAAAHERGMVHRDIKPENVMITGGTAKVLDFGLAQMAVASKVQADEPLLGTPGYMAPEQILGKDATPASDIFAAACVFVYALTGEDPFTGDDVREILTKTVKEDLDLSELPIGGGLRPTLSLALSKDPEDRPDAVALAEAFQLGRDESPDRYSFFFESSSESVEAEPPPWESTEIPAGPPGMAPPIDDQLQGGPPGMAPPVVGGPPGMAPPVVGGPPGMAPPVVGGPPGMAPPMAGGPPGMAPPMAGGPPGMAPPMAGQPAPPTAGTAIPPGAYGETSRSTAGPTWSAGAASAGKKTSVGGAGPGGNSKMLLIGVAVVVLVIIVVVAILVL
ncbi:MAG: hypothetical protein DCC49_02330 [Acidobacteria bacterium]|nr:MAG: hypothetical protein DCC49_02330 [Acidobacteriota bacterium]